MELSTDIRLGARIFNYFYVRECFLVESDYFILGVGQAPGIVGV